MIPTNRKFTMVEKMKSEGLPEIELKIEENQDDKNQFKLDEFSSSDEQSYG